MENTFTYGITENEAGMTVAEYLKSRGYSSRLVVRLRNTPGSFFVDGTAVFSTCVLKDGNQLQVRVAEKRSSAAVEPVPMDLDILYEDTHLLVVNKPAGMAVHPSQGNHGNTLANGLADYFRKKQEAFVFRAVNRLDKDTSGLLLVAKNGLSSSLLSGQVERREICREYLAAVCGKTDACGTVSVPIGRKEGSAIQRIPDPDHGEAASTRYERLLYNKNTDLSLLRLRLETGRTHQIRVHMKYIGHPLPGDFLYNPDFRYIRRQALHSVRLSFPHPFTGEVLDFSAPLPEDMACLFPGQELPSFSRPGADPDLPTASLSPWDNDF